MPLLIGKDSCQSTRRTSTGFDSKSAARRHIAGQGGQQDKRDDYDCEGQRIERAHAEERRAESSRQRQRYNQADDHAGAGQFEAVAEYQPRDVAALGTQCQADPELARPLADGEAHHSVDASSREDQRRERESANQEQAEAPAAERREIK